MKSFLGYYLRLLALPLSFAVLLSTVYAIWTLFSLPTGQEFADLVTGWYSDYGLLLVFLASIGEGFLLIGNYFPGSFVIIFGIALAGSVPDAVLIAVIGTLGLLIAHSINYTLGRFGWHKLLIRFGFGASIERSRLKLLERGGWAIFGSYWLPSMAAVIDSAAGVLKMPFRTFLSISIVSSIFWNGLVLIIVYSLGDRALELLASDSSNLNIMIFLIVTWMAVLILRDWRKRTLQKS